MRSHIQIIGESLREIAGLVSLFNPNEFAVTISEAPVPFEHLLAGPAGPPEAIIIRLTGKENIADFLSLHALYTKSAFVYLAAQFPPPAAVARVVARNGGVMLSVTESHLVTAATLIALMYQRQPASA
jgi:hypothetical protein